MGVLPQDWDVMKIGEFTDCTAGGTPSTKISKYWNGSIRWMSSGELNLRFVREVEGRITDAGLNNSSTKMIPKMCVLIGLAGQGKTRGTVAINLIPLCTNQSIAAIFPNKTFIPSYLYYNLDLRYEELRELSSGGSGRGGLNLSLIRKIQLPFPPLSEQRAIANALRDVDALLDSLDCLIAKKRDLKQAVMQQLLTGKTRLPGYEGKWEVVQIGSLGTFSKGQGIRKDEAMSGDISCVRYGEIYTHHNDVIRSFNSKISASAAKTSRMLKTGDLLFAGSGETKEEIGKCVAFVADEEAYAGGDIVILSPFKGNSIFFGYLFNTTIIARQKANKGQGDAVVHISSSALSSIEIPLPPEPEQQAIAAVLSDMDAEIAVLERRRNKTRDLKQAMMQELLIGKTRLISPVGCDV